MVIMTSFIFCIGFVLYTFKGSTFGRGNLDLRHRLSRHILFDVIFLFTVGLVYFGYPNVVLANVVSVAYQHISNNPMIGFKLEISRSWKAGSSSARL